MIIIGIDCAVDDKNIGLAKATYNGSELTVDVVFIGKKKGEVVSKIFAWLKERNEQPALLALDAPLGWPVAMAKELNEHLAGRLLSSEANLMFTRLTDRVVKKEIGKKPLDVGADRIARTAHAALELLQDLRNKTKESIPLAWDPDECTNLQAIEVYPAATLISRNSKLRKIKKDTQEYEYFVKREILSHEKAINIPDDLKIASHVLDAVVCLLAAKDFLDRECISFLQDQKDQVIKKVGFG